MERRIDADAREVGGQLVGVHAAHARANDDAEMLLLAKLIEEQQRLRRQYIDEFKENLKSTLDQVYIEREDGTYEKLKKKPPLN